MDESNVNTTNDLDSKQEKMKVSKEKVPDNLDVHQEDASVPEVNTTVDDLDANSVQENVGTKQETMDVPTIFRNLATGRYMEDFDYIATKFSFKAVYHTNAYSYCFCHCAFEHERLDYITRPGEINDDIFERILKCILDGRCQHVDNVPEGYIKETRVYGIHIVVAAGTIKALKDFTDPTRKGYGDTRRHGHMLAYRWLYQFDPYQVALVKNWEAFMVPQLTWFIYDHDWQEHEKRCYVDARRINTQGDNVIQMHFMSCLELCVRNKNVEVAKRYIDTIYEDNPIHMINALQLAFEENLDDLADVILHHKKLISEGLRCVGKGYKWIKQVCQLSILYEKPKVLDDLLREMVTQMSWREGREVDTAKQEAIALLEKLLQICKAIDTKETLDVVLKFCHKLNEDVSFENCSLSEKDKANVLGSLLIKHNLPVEKCISVLESVPTVSGIITQTNADGKCLQGMCLHAFNKFMVYERRRRANFLKYLIDLGASVNVMNKAGMTPLVHLMNIKIHRNYPHPREAEELYIYQNPDMNVHKSVFGPAVKSDQLFFKYKHDNIPSGFMVCWDYLMDGKLHGTAGHDRADFALTFMVPFLIEAGFNVSKSERNEIESAMDKLHPAEQEYLKHRLNMPRPLKLACRDVLRRHFNGREIHRYVQAVSVPQTVKDFILLKPLLRCVSEKLLH